MYVKSHSASLWGDEESCAPALHPPTLLLLIHTGDSWLQSKTGDLTVEWRTLLMAGRYTQKE